MQSIWSFLFLLGSAYSSIGNYRWKLRRNDSEMLHFEIPIRGSSVNGPELQVNAVVLMPKSSFPSLWILRWAWGLRLKEEGIRNAYSWGEDTGTQPVSAFLNPSCLQAGMARHLPIHVSFYALFKFVFYTQQPVLPGVVVIYISEISIGIRTAISVMVKSSKKFGRKGDYLYQFLIH